MLARALAIVSLVLASVVGPIPAAAQGSGGAGGDDAAGGTGAASDGGASSLTDQPGADGTGGLAANADAEALLVDLESHEQAFEAAMGDVGPDCEAACTAFESMLRAAKRVCELADDARCQAAREKIARAADRLRELCPGCAAVDSDEQRTVAAEPAWELGELDAAPAPASMPAEDAPRGTCAACRVGREGPPEAPWLLSLVLIAVYRMRRRRRR